MAAWSSYADGYPYTDSLGQSIKLTGHQMYVAINTQLQNVGEAQNPVPPLDNVTMAPVVTVGTLTSAGVGTLTLDGSGAAADFVLVAFSKPQSAGRNFVGNYWQQLVVAGSLATATLFGPAFIAQFGALVTGRKVFYKLTPVNQYGVTGSPTKGVILVT